MFLFKMPEVMATLTARRFVVTFIGHLGESQAADLEGVDEKLLFCNVLLSQSIHVWYISYIWLICMVNDADDEDDDDDDEDDENEDQGRSEQEEEELDTGRHITIRPKRIVAAGNG